MTRCRLLIFVVWLAAVFFGQRSIAATFRLRADVTAQRNLVTLGDVVAVEDCDPETRDSLASLPLFPAPPIGEVRFVSRDEIRDLLILRGIDTRMQIWSGAPQVRIVTSPSSATPPAKDKDRSQLRNLAEERLKAALEEYWRRVFPASPNFQFSFTLSTPDINWFSAVDARLVIKDVKSLAADTWLVAVEAQVGQERRTIDIQVKLVRPSQVVLAARPLSRDIIIGPADVLTSDQTEPMDSENTARIEDVLGKQLTMAIPAGKPIPRSALRDPIVIRRGESVQVVVRAPGVLIRTLGRAKDDGALSSLVPIETLESRGKTLLARVVGPKEVEVYAAGVQAGE
ncbi:MAG: flagellar basal body P-ring formation chaperone FlgA [Thermogutta sp.]